MLRVIVYRALGIRGHRARVAGLSDASWVYRALRSKEKGPLHKPRQSKLRAHITQVLHLPT